ncbi:MAG: plasmid partition protein ParG [Desulfurococcaceae archaeon]
MAKSYSKRTNINFEIEVYEALKKYCADKGITMSHLVNSLLKESLEKGYVSAERPKGYFKPTNINLDISLYKTLKKYCFDNNTTMTNLINEMVKNLLISEGYLPS